MVNDHICITLAAIKRLVQRAGIYHRIAFSICFCCIWCFRAKCDVVSAIERDPQESLCSVRQNVAVESVTFAGFNMLFVKGAIVEQGQVQEYLANKSGVTP